MFHEIIYEFSEFIASHIFKILGFLLAPFLKEITLRLIDKFQFSLKTNQFKRYKKSIKDIENICYNARHILDADRVTFIVVHNGTITYTNIHLAKISALVEVCSNGIASFKHETQNKIIENFEEWTDYFKNHKVMICNDIETFPDGLIKDEFEHRGIKSFFVLMIAKNEIPLGFIRVEYCHKKNHSQDVINTAINLLELKEKKLWKALKP